MQSPLLLPLTLIAAGVLAFMATTGILPPALFRLWPVIFVILGVVGLLSLSSEDLLEPSTAKSKKKSTKSTKSSQKTSSRKKSTASKKSTSSKKNSTKSGSKKKASRSKSKKK